MPCLQEVFIVLHFISENLVQYKIFHVVGFSLEVTDTNTDPLLSIIMFIGADAS
jgi:hypothetical protein